MRFGASTDLRFGQNNIEFLEILYFNGFSHIEIRKDSDHVYGQVNPSTLRRSLSKYGFTVSYHVPHREFNLASVNEDIRKCCVSQVIAIGEYLHEIGQGWVNIHAGHVPNSYHKNAIIKAKSNCMKSLDEIAEAFKALNTEIFLENDSKENGLIKFGLTPVQMKGLLEDYPEFYMTFDLGHCHNSGFQPLNFIEPLRDKIRAAHLHDNHGIKDEHLALGEGNVDFASAIKLLEDCCEYYIFEMRSLSDIIKSREYLELIKNKEHIESLKVK
ncbi:MAG: sugar phosphate isomerase/epimerase family protein [Methanosarcina sp.]